MAVDIEDFFGLIRGRVPNCLNVLMRDAVVAAADEFCRRTQLLVDETSVSVVAGNRFVDLSPPDGEVFIVHGVRRAEWSLTPMSRHVFEQQRLDVRPGTPVAYYIEGNRRLVLGPIPEANETLIVRYVVRVDPEATEVNDRLFIDWRQGIAAGARAYIRRTHGAPWDDPAEESADRDFFEQEINRANLDRAQGGTRKALRTRGTYF